MLDEREIALRGHIDELERDLRSSKAQIASLELALRQRSMQLEALDGCEAVTIPSRSTPVTVPYEVAAVGINETIAFLREHLNGAYYLQENPDVARAGIDPILHYVLHGEREGRRPSPDFDPVYYRVMSPSLANFKGNLFWHYLKIAQVGVNKKKR